MKWLKACLKSESFKTVSIVSLLTLGLAGAVMSSSGGSGPSRSRYLNVYTNNNTSKPWNATECVNSQCTAFPISAQGYHTAAIPEPGTGTATLKGIFTSTGTFNPIQCSSLYNVNTSTVAIITITKTSSSYYCIISNQ